MSPGINVCTRKWHPQHAEIAQIKQKGPGQLLLSYLSTCSNRLLQFCNLHSLSWVDLHWSLINCRLRILGLARYTPLVEVNQAIIAWSFRQTPYQSWVCKYRHMTMTEAEHETRESYQECKFLPSGRPYFFQWPELFLCFRQQILGISGVFSVPILAVLQC